MQLSRAEPGSPPVVLDRARDKRESEPDEIEPEIVGALVPECDKALRVGVTPCPAADDTSPIAKFVFTHELGYCLAAVPFPVVQTPFGHVSGHVIQAKFVRLFLSHRMRL